MRSAFIVGGTVLERAGLVFAVALSFIVVDANSAEIVLERTGVEKLVVQALFKDQGRLVLARGPCTSYLEQPSVTLANGRIRSARICRHAWASW